jgi:hypothetical protein
LPVKGSILAIQIPSALAQAKLFPYQSISGSIRLCVESEIIVSLMIKFCADPIEQLKTKKRRVYINFIMQFLYCCLTIEFLISLKSPFGETSKFEWCSVKLVHNVLGLGEVGD